jgi:hypothetical protein
VTLAISRQLAARRTFTVIPSRLEESRRVSGSTHVGIPRPAGLGMTVSGDLSSRAAARGPGPGRTGIPRRPRLGMTGTFAFSTLDWGFHYPTYAGSASIWPVGRGTRGSLRDSRPIRMTMPAARRHRMPAVVKLA